MSALGLVTIFNNLISIDMPCLAAKRYVEKLVDGDVLQETAGYARNRVFLATKIFKALENSG